MQRHDDHLRKIDTLQFNDMVPLFMLWIKLQLSGVSCWLQKYAHLLLDHSPYLHVLLWMKFLAVCTHHISCALESTWATYLTMLVQQVCRQKADWAKSTASWTAAAYFSITWIWTSLWSNQICFRSAWASIRQWGIWKRGCNTKSHLV